MFNQQYEYIAEFYIQHGYGDNAARALLHVFPDIGLDPLKLYGSWSSLFFILLTHLYKYDIYFIFIRKFLEK